MHVSTHNSQGSARKSMRVANRRVGYERIHRVQHGFVDCEYCEHVVNGETEYAIAPYAVALAEYYDSKIVKNKIVKNLMSGKNVTIKSNTPLCCDPSSETYWSM